MGDQIKLKVDWYGEDAERKEFLGQKYVRGSHGSIEMSGSPEDFADLIREASLPKSLPADNECKAIDVSPSRELPPAKNESDPPQQGWWFW